MHLDSDHSVAGVAFLSDEAFVDGLREAGPSCSGVELVGATEERRTASDAPIDPCLFVVVVGIGKWALGAVVSGHVVLQLGEALAPFLLCALNRKCFTT